MEGIKSKGSKGNRITLGRELERVPEASAEIIATVDQMHEDEE